MKYIRRSLINECFGNKELLKALAMAYLIKHRTKSSNIRHYSINLIHSITGIHATTIRKRLQTLNEYGLILIEKDNLIIRSTVSKHSKRNMNIGRMDFTNAKTVERSLQALQVVLYFSIREPHSVYINLSRSIPVHGSFGNCTV